MNRHPIRPITIILVITEWHAPSREVLKSESRSAAKLTPREPLRFAIRIWEARRLR
jgi:hypothetical protein